MSTRSKQFFFLTKNAGQQPALGHCYLESSPSNAAYNMAASALKIFSSFPGENTVYISS